MKHVLTIDLETFGGELEAGGVYRYTEAPDFAILIMAYSLDGADVQVIDTACGEEPPAWLVAALHDPDYIKASYNAAFEMTCLGRYYGEMDPAQWSCSMIHGLYAGYPAGLEDIGKAIGLPLEKQKLSIGKSLIKYFCIPCNPTKRNGGRTRNLPEHDPEKWALFKEYCKQDVMTEMEIDRRLQHYPVPAFIHKQWETDQRINRRGIYVDLDLVQGALDLDAEAREGTMEEARELTGLKNPNSAPQVLGWLRDQEGLELPNYKRGTIAAALQDDSITDDARRVLEIRQELGKTSTRKYNAISACVCKDNRVRGVVQFYGAGRTGRWAGRLVQVQNLPRTYTKLPELARELVKNHNAAALQMLYGSVPDTLSQLIRTAFIASPRHVLVDADFSAIEARVSAWLAGEEWKLDAFRTGKDIYCETASQMYHVPVVKHGENGHLRQKGKIAELACSYQGGVGAMRAISSSGKISEEEMAGIVKSWRQANPKIVRMWYQIQDAVTHVIRDGGSSAIEYLQVHCETNPVTGTRVLVVMLPSGRNLYYLNPRIGTNRFGGPAIVYDGLSSQDLLGRPKTKIWGAIETYGGRIFENCVQAIARDCLAEAIERLEAAGFPIVFHVHDEVIIDIKPYADPEKMLADVVEIMSEVPVWAPGLPLTADGWVGSYFTKE